MSDALTPNERAALDELMFELSAPHTLEEIAQHLGISLRHVSRIEQRALRRMRELAAEEWRAGLKEPRQLVRRTGEIAASNGAATTPWSDGGTHDGTRT